MQWLLLNSREGIELVRITDWKIEKFKTNRLICDLNRIWKIWWIQAIGDGHANVGKGETHPATRRTSVEHSVEECIQRRALARVQLSTHIPKNWKLTCAPWSDPTTHDLTWILPTVLARHVSLPENLKAKSLSGGVWSTTLPVRCCADPAWSLHVGETVIVCQRVNHLLSFVFR